MDSVVVVFFVSSTMSPLTTFFLMTVVVVVFFTVVDDLIVPTAGFLVTVVVDVFSVVGDFLTVVDNGFLVPTALRAGLAVAVDGDLRVVVRVVEVLVTVLGDLAVVADNDLFKDFSFNGELAVFSIADVERRADVFVADGDFVAVPVVVDVPLTRGFAVKPVGFVAGTLLAVGADDANGFLSVVPFTFDLTSVVVFAGAGLVVGALEIGRFGTVDVFEIGGLASVGLAAADAFLTGGTVEVVFGRAEAKVDVTDFDGAGLLIGTFAAVVVGLGFVVFGLTSGFLTSAGFNGALAFTSPTFFVSGFFAAVVPDDFFETAAVAAAAVPTIAIAAAAAAISSVFDSILASSTFGTSGTVSTVGVTSCAGASIVGMNSCCTDSIIEIGRAHV